MTVQLNVVQIILEMDPRMLNNDQGAPSTNLQPDNSTGALSQTSNSCYSGIFLGSSSHPQNNGTSLPSADDLDLQEPFSPLVDMDWMDSDPNNQYLEGLGGETDRPAVNDSGFIYSGSTGLDWLSDVMHLDSVPSKNTSSFNHANSSDSMNSSSDPLLSPKPPDVMNIFEIDETNFRATPDTGSDINWDKLIGQT